MAKECISDCSLETTGFNYTMSLIQGKYKMYILYTLMEFHVVRSNEMQNGWKRLHIKTPVALRLKTVGSGWACTPKGISANSAKSRIQLTEAGKSLIPILDQMRKWGDIHRKSKS